MKRLIPAILLLIGSTQSLHAAIPKLELQEDAKMALRLPLENRVRTLKMQGPKSFETVESLAFNQKENIQIRWRSITALGIMDPQKARKPLEKAMQSSEWFVRNAGIIAAARGDRSWALGWAQRLLNDEALVVRTAAVQTLYKINGIEAEGILWEKLYARENYKGGQSLWVRKYIAQTLARFASRGQESKFVRILQDPDKSLHEYGVKALEKITGSNFRRKSKLTSDQRKLWLDWWFKARG